MISRMQFHKNDILGLELRMVKLILDAHYYPLNLRNE